MKTASERGPDASLESDGWVLLPRVLDAPLVARLNEALEAAYTAQREIQKRNGIGEGTDGTVHHLACMRGAFFELLERDDCRPQLSEFFGGPYILNTFGGVLNLPDNVAYVGHVHRDIRTFCGRLNLMAQLLVMLDDFTEDNGATYFLSGSHARPDRPGDDEFFAQAATGASVVADGDYGR